MVLVWNMLQSDRISKLSGLKYLRTLIEQADIRQPENSFWVMPSAAAAERNAAWLRANGISVADENIYIAPIYGAEIRDLEILKRLEERRPQASGARHWRRNSGAAGFLPEAAPELPTGNSLCWSSHCISLRRSGPNSRLGRRSGPWLVVAEHLKSAAFCPAVLGCPSSCATVVALSGPLAGCPLFSGRHAWTASRADVGFMQTLHIIDSLSPATGGPPEAVRQLAKAYREVGAGIEVVCLDNPGEPFLSGIPCPVHALGQSYLGRYGFSPRLWRWLRENSGRFDGIVMHGIWTFPGVALRHAARRSEKALWNLRPWRARSLVPPALSAQAS